MSPLFKGKGPGCQKNRLIWHLFKGTESSPDDVLELTGVTAPRRSFWGPGDSAAMDSGEAEVISRSQK